MGIVLVYRSYRVINFAVGSIGIPSAALFAVMAGVHGWPYWPSLILSLILGTLTGVVVELAVIRRLFRSPRVIVLVATIGVAQLCEAITLAYPRLPHQIAAVAATRCRSKDVEPGSPPQGDLRQFLVLIIVPVITRRLWWVLGHTRSVTRCGPHRRHCDLAR